MVVVGSFDPLGRIRPARPTPEILPHESPGRHCAVLVPPLPQLGVPADDSARLPALRHDLGAAMRPPPGLSYAEIFSSCSPSDCTRRSRTTRASI